MSTVTLRGKYVSWLRECTQKIYIIIIKKEMKQINFPYLKGAMTI